MADQFNAKLSVSDLDFDSIKSSLKNYLSKQEQFKDINFEGSGINVIMDLLAYNTHYQGFYSNMIANEMFLDSALKRDSIVSIAKHLGYTPTSITAPTALVDIAIPSGIIGDAIEKGTEIKGTQGSSSYTFSFMDDSAITYDAEGLTAATNIKIGQGRFENIAYIVDNDIKQKFLLPKYADISTLTIRVQTSQEDNTGFATKWTLGSDLNSIGKTDKAYHVQEVSKGEYEVYFGDGIVGVKPTSGNVIIIEYLNTKGSEANGFGKTDKAGSRVFTYSGGTVKVLSEASGGGDGETNNSIKYYAPRSYQAQDRAVTERDYEAILLRDYPDVESVTIWGGQDHDPPEYGKVFIALKPKSGLTIDLLKKEQISKDILSKSNVVSVIPELVDPEYLFVQISIKLTYDPSVTILGKNEIITVVKSAVTDYIRNDLEKFDKDLYFSKLSRKIDLASESIVGNEISIKLQTRFSPDLLTKANYKIPFGNSIKHIKDGDEPILHSTSFTYKDDDNVIFLGYLEDDGYGVMRIWKMDSLGNKVIVYSGADKVGTLDYEKGVMNLKDFRPLSTPGTNHIRLTTTPRNNNIFATQRQILTLDSSDIESIQVETKTLLETSRGRPGISTNITDLGK